MLPISGRPKDRLIHVFFATLIIISFIPLIIGCASFLKPLNVVYGSYTIMASDDHNYDGQDGTVHSNDLRDISTPTRVPTLVAQPTIRPSAIPTKIPGVTTTPTLTPPVAPTVTPTPTAIPKYEDTISPTPVPTVTYPGRVDTIYGTPTPGPILVTATPVPTISANGAAANVTYKNAVDNTTYGNDTAAPPASGSNGSISILILANLMIPFIASAIMLYGKFWNRGN